MTKCILTGILNEKLNVEQNMLGKSTTFPFPMALIVI